MISLSYLYNYYQYHHPFLLSVTLVPNLWNSLSIDVKKIKPFCSFCQNVKNSMIDGYNSVTCSRHPLFFSVYRHPTDPNFWQFQKKKRKDVVTPFFTWNNSFNLKHEHSNSIEKNRNKNMNIFHSILYILLIQICEC